MNYPIVRQRETNDCGPACLVMVARYFGKRVSLASLRRQAGTDGRGTSLAGLIQAAAGIGFRCRGLRASPGGLVDAVGTTPGPALGHSARTAIVRRRVPGAISLPAIAHWDEGGRQHFVVLYELTHRGVTVGDPACGRRRMTFDEFAERWTGVLLVLRPDDREAPEPDVPKKETATRGSGWP